MARASSIDQLPDDIRDALHELLRDPAVTQLETAQRVNQLLSEEGHPIRVSKSAVNRYSQRMDQIGEKMRQSRQIADMWIGKLGNQPQGKVGAMLNEFTRTMAFETALTMSEGDDPIPPKLLKELALAIKHLEEASSVNEKREREIRRLATEEAAETAGALAKAAGLTAAGVADIKKQILGIA
ncbi:DUF3486 family protein [Marinobacterium rhizophilum]|uniref:DUF3486 family protein n=1 Tax=Marinobacterium rhizophilum TaxID=420402 RepID=A0ABY5HKM6_9GAMM|nr:DUF3486 family protein [Marinobacterium rhizophilum]UTW12945.1 DUF3486 family protein [Marinobacterium rhizophilum]